MPYTPIITPADLKTVIYAAIIEEITREDETIVTEAIASAIEEVKSFIGRFNLIALFGDEATDTPATVSDVFLTRLVKDVAAWQLIKLANPNMNYDHIKTCYEDAIGTLKRIQSVKQTPAKWPLIDPSEIQIVQGNPVSYNSITKRRNNW